MRTIQQSLLHTIIVAMQHCSIVVCYICSIAVYYIYSEHLAAAEPWACNHGTPPSGGRSRMIDGHDDAREDDRGWQ